MGLELKKTSAIAPNSEEASKYLMILDAVCRTIKDKSGKTYVAQSLAERIHRQNLRRYRYELWTATSASRRAMLLSLIATEDAKAISEGWAPERD